MSNPISSVSGAPKSGGSSNISVGVRIRPRNEKEIAAEMPVFFTKASDGSSIEELDENGAVLKHWSYDHIFGVDSTNEEIFQRVGVKLVDAAMEGYNTVIFLYGQTSSGKTFTLFGDNKSVGLVQLAMEHVQMVIKNSTDTEYIIKVNYAELYNEEIKDLLSATPNENLKIVEDPNMGPYIQNITEANFTSAIDIKAMLDEGENRRHFGVTNMNAHSSRSHVIVRLIIESRKVNYRIINPLRTSWGKDRPNCISTLNLVDLAGSERANKAGTSGERLKEGSYINKSLLTLGTVIASLSEGKYQHIPYRNSKLTRLLATALGGNAKTCMISCISPASGNLAESLNTLRFSARAKRIVNHVHKNEIMDMKTLTLKLTAQASEIEMLRHSLELSRQLGFTPDDVSQGETLREKVVSSSKRWRCLKFMLLSGARIINGLRGEGMSHLAKTALGSMRQAISGERDLAATHEELSVLINTYLSKDRELIQQAQDVDFQNESEENSASVNLESDVKALKGGDVFTLLEKGDDELREQFELSCFGAEDIRSISITIIRKLEEKLSDSFSNEKKLRKIIEESQQKNDDLRETIKSMKISESSLQKQIEDVKLQWKTDAGIQGDKLRSLTAQIFQNLWKSYRTNTIFNARTLELASKEAENEKLRGQLEMTAMELNNAIATKKSLEEETRRVRIEMRTQMDRLRLNMHQMMVKGGEESKVIESHNTLLQKQLDKANDALQTSEKTREQLQHEVSILRSTIAQLTEEDRLRQDEIANLREETFSLSQKLRVAKLDKTDLSEAKALVAREKAHLESQLAIEVQLRHEMVSSKEEELESAKRRFDSKAKEMQLDIDMRDAELISLREQLNGKQQFINNIEFSLGNDISRLEKKLAAQNKLSEELKTENGNLSLQIQVQQYKHLDEVKALRQKISDLQGVVDSINSYVDQQEKELLQDPPQELIGYGYGAYESFYDSPLSRAGSQRGSFLRKDSFLDDYSYASSSFRSPQFGADARARDSILEDIDYISVEDEEDQSRLDTTDAPSSLPFSASKALQKRGVSFRDFPPAEIDTSRSALSAAHDEDDDVSLATFDAAVEVPEIDSGRYERLLYGLTIATAFMEHNLNEERLVRETLFEQQGYFLSRIHESDSKANELKVQSDSLNDSQNMLQSSMEYTEKKLQLIEAKFQALESQYNSLSKDYARVVGAEKLAATNADRMEQHYKDTKIQFDRVKGDLQRHLLEFNEVKLHNARLSGKIEEIEEENAAIQIKLDIAVSEKDILIAERNELVKRFLPALKYR